MSVQAEGRLCQSGYGPPAALWVPASAAALYASPAVAIGGICVLSASCTYVPFSLSLSVLGIAAEELW